jgi:hypothetical protein
MSILRGFETAEVLVDSEKLVQDLVRFIVKPLSTILLKLRLYRRGLLLRLDCAYLIDSKNWWVESQTHFLL